MEWAGGRIRVAAWYDRLWASFDTYSADPIELQIRFRAPSRLTVDLGVHPRFGRHMFRHDGKASSDFPWEVFEKYVDKSNLPPLFGVVELPPLTRRCESLFSAELPPLHRLPWVDPLYSKLYADAEQLQEQLDMRRLSAAEDWSAFSADGRLMVPYAVYAVLTGRQRELTCPSMQG